MKTAVLAATLLVVIPVCTANATDVASFLVRAETVQRKGVMAMFSGDARSMMAELKTATKALKAERLAAEAAGRRPAYCPTGKVSFSQSEILASLRAVPPAERSRVQVKDALRASFGRKYPCPT